jgi:hypothetical protein
MMENLPPPNWSPTGNSGYWVWDEEHTELVGKERKIRPAWRWYDDVYGYEWNSSANRTIRGGSFPKKESWIQKLKRLLKL